jgi:hypothetical protein
MESAPLRDSHIVFTEKVFDFLYFWPPNDELFCPYQCEFCR